MFWKMIAVYGHRDQTIYQTWKPHANETLRRLEIISNPPTFFLILDLQIFSQPLRSPYRQTAKFKRVWTKETAVRRKSIIIEEVAPSSSRIARLWLVPCIFLLHSIFAIFPWTTFNFQSIGLRQLQFFHFIGKIQPHSYLEANILKN